MPFKYFYFFYANNILKLKDCFEEEHQIILKILKHISCFGTAYALIRVFQQYKNGQARDCDAMVVV